MSDKEPQHIAITIIDGNGMTTDEPEDHVHSDNEKFYDEHIAPKLLELPNLCIEREMPFLAVVEYNAGEPDNGCTKAAFAGQSLSMTMLQYCHKTAPNIDAYIMGLARHCKKNDIDMSGSIYLSRFGD